MAFSVPYDEFSQSASRTIEIRHRIGRKGSKFFKEYPRSALENLIERAMFHVTDCVKFDLNE
jgi:hypothetical protein